ncbi:MULTISPECIES: ABC transporter substrate-binding protein [Bradyrhizobium]|uniref:ABC transporter substrate-binding protein n=4 Tax=Bradyrhizobium TaxID=374 RepID=A0A410VIP6_9BRAD|nr:MULTISPECIES: sugar ABC transporter substrate-binding protein [Bradyrhizobium]QOZ57196.1 sugar ABC transporter substrate-binding protein [Bradyrhizobium sp. CCBAU 53338]QOZ81149.1 sugar ABC transporter substrate-binding protein [Bradyrhizobium sp. CCBAU 53351]MCG2628085.1 sugar ABC transporter substrate-binding protein [Bradyrhizobium zhengyangense]MCG2643204.1 sugar ABC transporter substrate-binding protein [Bradyrhizobium zhengyangense]MCG2670482.1 sugar ABC transporter substrate-binding 
MPRTLAVVCGHSAQLIKKALINSTVCAGAALAATQAYAEDINWRQFEGTSIVWAYDIHPYADAVAAQLPEFEKLTGIKVTPELYPDDAYWNKLTIQLSTKSPSWDVVGTGIQPAWDLAPGQLLEPLDRYLNDSKLTSAAYDYKDFFPALREALTWKVKEGQIEAGSGQVWAIPHGFENIQLFYRKDVLDKHGIKVPSTPPEMSAACEKLKAADPTITPLGVRGVRFWSSIHTAAISIARSYGVHDFVVKDGKLDTGLDSPESIAFHKDYVDMIKKCAAPSFANDNWYQVVEGINSGRTAMAIDSNMFGFWNDVAGKPASGKIAFAPPLRAPNGKNFESNIWIWSLAMNAASQKKGAAWLFIQWATSKQVELNGAVAGKLVNSPRASTWSDKAWLEYAAKPEFNNFVETFKTVQDQAQLAFTARVGFAEAMNAWAVAMQKMVNGADVKATLTDLASEIRSSM